MKKFALTLLAACLVANAQDPARIREAATRSLALLQKASTGFYQVQDCFSCHNMGLPARAYAIARERGIALDEPAIHSALVKALTHGPDLSSMDRVVQYNMIIDPASSEGSALLAAHTSGLKPNLSTAVQARLIANYQRPDGHYPTIDQRPPQGHSIFTATAIAARAIQMYLPEEMRKESEERTERARAWFLKTSPQTTEDSTYRLIGLAWTGATDEQCAGPLRDLKALQRPDGGWAQLPRMEPDAYATGEALVALNEAGVPVSDPAWRKGLNWLLANQNPDGSWRVHTRMVSPAKVSPPYFESGFPFAHDQFISSSGTSYATMALLLALPKAAKAAAPLPLHELEPKGVQPWMRVALFGTSGDLKAMLDRGLDPNSRTEGGTTILMMAAPDLAKMKLLVDKGADVKAISKSGYTAMMVASLYQGSRDSLKLLLDHGAGATPGKGVLFNASPLMLAALANDAANVALLHGNGGDANRKMLLLGAFPSSPLNIAVSSGDVPTMRALIAAGADLHELDPDGLNLLDFAVLGNHIEAAQALIAAGVPVNQKDNFGYTPLLYASTVDFGDSRMVDLLLRSGADPSTRSKDGKTALTQAKMFRSSYIQASLERAGARE